MSSFNMFLYMFLVQLYIILFRHEKLYGHFTILKILTLWILMAFDFILIKRGYFIVFRTIVLVKLWKLMFFLIWLCLKIVVKTFIGLILFFDIIFILLIRTTIWPNFKFLIFILIIVIWLIASFYLIKFFFVWRNPGIKLTVVRKF